MVPLSEFAETVGIVILPLLFIAGLVALVLSAIALLLPPESGFIRLGYGSFALLLAVEMAWIGLYALGPDTYYSSGVSRWEHADRWGKTPIVVAAMAISAATVFGLLINTVSPRARLRLLAMPAAALACVMLLTAWFFLTAGH